MPVILFVDGTKGGSQLFGAKNAVMFDFSTRNKIDYELFVPI